MPFRTRFLRMPQLVFHGSSVSRTTGTTFCPRSARIVSTRSVTELYAMCAPFVGEALYRVNTHPGDVTLTPT